MLKQKTEEVIEWLRNVNEDELEKHERHVIHIALTEMREKIEPIYNKHNGIITALPDITSRPNWRKILRK